MIHVCFGLYDKTGRYAKFTGTAMLSLFENTNALPQSITVHILHDNTLTPDNRDKFIYLAGQYNQLVKFYNVEKLCTEKIQDFLKKIPAIKDSNFSIGTMYRLLIPYVLPTDIEKIIYLDSDIVVNTNIKQLWQIELGDKILAAVSEQVCGTKIEILFLCTSGLIKSEDYFNAGVMMINLKSFREYEKNIEEGIAFYSKHPQCFCLDQDILNYCFHKKWLKLPPDFNVFVIHARKRKEAFGKKIYHYAGTSNTFTLGIRDDFYRLWMNSFMRTPFFDEETIGNLYDSFEQIYFSLKKSMINLSLIMSNKTRVFFTAPQNVEEIKKIFLIQDDEEIIIAENNEALQKLIDAMKKARGKKIFFILFPKFPFKVLIQEGFSFGKDFLNGFEFLSKAQGVTLNSYSLVQAM
ncbi:MAG: glycosyltransferase family 8 protein [Selenomonadaceae bacterium]|nr:glycosyltransferase family 8 protein [Selenomonadaceae bacterium]